MRESDAKKLLLEKDKSINLLAHIGSVLGWDYETILPKEASDERCEQLGLISELHHVEATAAPLREAVETLKGAKELNETEKALVRSYDKFFKTEANLPTDFVRELSETSGQAHTAWLEGREKDDFSIFLPTLKRLIELSEERAKIIAPEKKPYDALLDLYEEDMTMETLDRVFGDLEESIHSIMDKIGDKKSDDTFLYASYQESDLHAFCNEVIKRMGFDFNRGLVGYSAHPFTTTLGRDDIRITTRYTDPAIIDPISSIVHECGHALYEQHAALNSAIRGTSLSNGASLGIHESQSRFWENLMGKSYSFWAFEYPLLQKAIPSLETISLDSFYKAINNVTPSAIRVNADEVTYSLHIILRYRIEKAIFEHSVSVNELPSLWNELSSSILRYKPLNDKEGILQDVHWSQGSFGYFPTYALGNLYGAMFRTKLIEDLGGEAKLEAVLSSGDWSPITNWQNENIWRYGCLYTPSELLNKVTGRKLDASDFKKYLEVKYSKIYSL